LQKETASSPLELPVSPKFNTPYLVIFPNISRLCSFSGKSPRDFTKQGDVTEARQRSFNPSHSREKKKKIARADLADFRKRLRAAVKAVFGDDSPIYEEVGGKRRSERKRPTKKSTAE